MGELLPGFAPASVGQAEACSRLRKGDDPPFMEKEIRCGTTHHHHPKTVVIVTVVRSVVVAVGRARVVSIVNPRPAAHHAPFARWPRAQLPVPAMSCNALCQIALWKKI